MVGRSRDMLLQKACSQLEFDDIMSEDLRQFNIYMSTAESVAENLAS